MPCATIAVTFASPAKFPWGCSGENGKLEFKKKNGAITALLFSADGTASKAFEKNAAGDYLPKAN